MSLPSLEHALFLPEDLVIWYKDAEKEHPHLLHHLCLAITERVEGPQGVNRQILSRTHTDEVHDGNGDQFLELRHPPVTELTGVKYEDEAQTLENFVVKRPDIGMIYHSSGFGREPSWMSPEPFGIGSRESGRPEDFTSWGGSVDTTGIWKFTYIGGYADVPWDLKRVAIQMAIHELRTNPNIGTAAFSADGYSEQRWALGDQSVMDEWKKTFAVYNLAAASF